MNTTNIPVVEQEIDEMKTHGAKSKIEKISFAIFLSMIFLVPIVFIKTSFSPLDTIKENMIAFGVLISTLLCVIATFKTKNVFIPKTILLLPIVGIVISLLISVCINPGVSKSLFGQGFELFTVNSLFILLISLFLSIYLTYKNKDRVVYIFGAIMASFLIIALFHIIRFFTGPDFMSFGVFQSTISTVLGKWADLGVYSAIVGIISYISLQFLILKKSFKILLNILVVLSVILIFLVNSSVVWFAVSLTLLGIVMYQYHLKSVHHNKKGFLAFFNKLPKLSVIILIVASLMTFKGTTISGPITSKLGIAQGDIYLPWQMTLDVASETIKQSPLFGVGPNKFGFEYLKYKPLVINNTQFWGVEFNSGFSMIATFFVNQGLVGVFFWVLLIILFIRLGMNELKKENDELARFLVASTFFISLFLWITTIVYNPSHTILLLTFIFTGLFISVSLKDVYVVKKNFIHLTLTLTIIVLIAWLFILTTKATSLLYFQSGIGYLNVQKGIDLEKAEVKFKKALAWSKTDVGYQALSELSILKVNQIIQNAQGKPQNEAIDPELVKQINVNLAEADQSSKSAIEIDPLNYYNYLSLARVSELSISLKSQGAYENAKNAYIEAIKLNPYSPLLYLSLARIEASQNKLDEAQRYIGNALQLKQDYLDAIFLLSQIQISQGKIKDAITSVKVATQINPNDPTLFFQLGFLLYNDQNYQASIDAFTKALKLDNKYANAQYFLGLAYARVAQYADAIIQFDNLAVTNPDNKEVVLILANLRAGKSPFAEAKAPIDSKPEKRKTLPIKNK